MKGQVLQESQFPNTMEQGIQKTQLEKAKEEQESLWEKNDHVSVLKIQHWRSIGP